MQIKYPNLYQINPRLLLASRSRNLERPATLADITDSELDAWAGLGFDWIYLLGAWQTGAYGRAEARRHPGLQAEYRLTLPGLRPEDICGSPFAVAAYEPADWLGGTAALYEFRRRLQQRGLRLMLDFIANHTAVDHPWAERFPERYISGVQEDLLRPERTHILRLTSRGERILAHGRDPFFPPWTDTLQLNYANPETHAAVIAELLRIVEFCDGLRCDMAMLLLPDVFERTWGARPQPFWPAAVAALRGSRPGFTLMAEVYWGLEWTLQQQGFDFTYDKTLYDRLLNGSVQSIRGHLGAEPVYRDRLVRFLENHDEPRAAERFALPVHQAAAIITFLTPGLRFFHHGQLEGWRRHVPVQLCRPSAEPANLSLEQFYRTLLALLRRPILRAGAWRLLAPEPHPDRPGWENLLAWLWEQPGNGRLLVVVNYCGEPAAYRLNLGASAAGGIGPRFTALLTSGGMPAAIDLPVDAVVDLEAPPWGFGVWQQADA